MNSARELREYLSIVMQGRTNDRNQAVAAVGTYLSAMANDLPTFYHGLLVEPPKTRPVDQHVVEQVSIAQLVGHEWLFGDQQQWPQDELRWKRLATLLLTRSVPVQLNTTLQITAILRNNLVSATKMRAESTFWIGDGYRRIYAAWLLGCDTVPLYIDAYELE